MIQAVFSNPLHPEYGVATINKSIQTYNNLMGCQPYAKHRFR